MNFSRGFSSKKLKYCCNNRVIFHYPLMAELTPADHRNRYSFPFVKLHIMISPRCITVLLSLLCLSLFYLSGCQQDEPPAPADYIAKVGDDYTIPFSELDRYTQENFFNFRYSPPSKGYHHALNILINRQLKRIDFFESGYHQDEELMSHIRRIINEELVAEYYEVEYLNPLVEDQAVEDAYESLGREVTYREIVLDKPQNASEQQLNQIRDLAFQLQTDIQSGEADFATLVREYSQNPESAEMSGYRPPVTWQNSFHSDFSNTVFQLGEGETRILETSQNVYLIKAARVDMRETPPLNEVRQRITRTLRQRYEEATLDQFYDEKERIVTKDAISWNEQALEHISEWTTKPGFFDETYTDVIQDAIHHGRNKQILQWEEGSVDFEEMLFLMEHILIPDGSGYMDIEKLKEYFTEALQQQVLVERAREVISEEDILHANTTNPALRTALVRIYDRAAVNPRIPEPSQESLRDFYHQNRDSLYYQLATINSFVLVSEEKEQAEEWMNRVNHGEAFEELEGRYLVRSFYRDKQGQIHSLHSQEPPSLGPVVFDMELEEVRGPVSYEHPQEGLQHAVVKKARSRPEKQLTYNDVQDRLKEDFMDFHSEKKNKEVLEELRNNYTVDINEELLQTELNRRSIE